MASQPPPPTALRLLCLALSVVALVGSADGQVQVHAADLPAIRDLATAAGLQLPDPAICNTYYPSSSGPYIYLLCDGTGRVTKLNSNDLLMSTIPDSIGSLSEATQIFLEASFTSPRVTLPHSISRLTSIINLYFYGGYGRPVGSFGLTGTVPATIGALTKLVEFGIGGTSMTGSIPETISLLQSLTYLELADSLFTGFLPEALCVPPLNAFWGYNNAFYGGLVSCMLNASDPHPSASFTILDNNFLSHPPAAGKLGRLTKNCFGAGFVSQKTAAECGRFCGLPLGVPPDSWFDRPCVPTNPQNLFTSGNVEMSNIVFKRMLKRTCGKSAGPCGMANCKGAGGWCRRKKTLCCCTAGKDPVFDPAGNIVGCNRRISTARTSREKNMD